MTIHHVKGSGQIRPTFAAELARAHQFADVAVLVGLAFRRHRASVAVSQRAYAQWRGWSKARQARFEGHAEDQRLGDVACALQGTGYRLVVMYEGGETSLSASPATSPPASAATPALARQRGQEGTSMAVPSDWNADEFVARDEAGRRFPAHKRVRRTAGPPMWWMFRYSTSRGVWPEWTAAE